MCRRILLSACGALLWLSTAGQARLTTRLSRDSALIGDTVSYSLLVRGGGGAEMFFVELADTVARGGELWEAPRIDTLANNRESIELRLQLVVTSYDSGEVVLPRFGVLVRHAGVLDTLYSEPQGVSFYPLPREAGVEDIKDIRGPLGQRLTFAEVWPWLLGVLVLVLAVLGVVLYRRHMRRGEVIGASGRLVPPDELALDRLRRLREEKTWREQGMKFFYTEVSDTLREFVSSEFGIRAMECTSSKIVRDLRADVRCRREWIKTVETTLQLADLTKFARFTPREQDCLESIEQVERLVHEIHQALHVESHEEATTSQEEVSAEKESGGEASGSLPEEREESKAARDAERYGPRNGGRGVEPAELEERE